MRTKAETPLHISTGYGSEARLLCGTEKRTTYRDLDNGTNTRVINGEFFGPRHPEWGSDTVCAGCLTEFGD